ncbi:hypothetical protein SY83_02405 [Paenibacillus swuensis]|uniref:Uncharacterized protein n=1 Tax=Paenibacillus swuensis TaxID=1178515 RepID=A0A172TEK9_9BACL|nr:hypothetical protein SY83_02405 [Paenibacillus swuensis]
MRSIKKLVTFITMLCILFTIPFPAFANGAENSSGAGGFPPLQLVQRWVKWYDALNNRECAETASCQKRDEEIRAVKAFRDQIKALDSNNPDHLALVDPLWNEVKSQFPAGEQQAIRKELLECIKLLGIAYTGDSRDLVQLYKAFQPKQGLLQKLSKQAGIEGGIRLADAVEFLFGSPSYKGFEQGFNDYWRNTESTELFAMIQSKDSSRWYISEAKILQKLLKRPDANNNKVAKLINYYKLLSPQTMLALGNQDQIATQLLSKYPAARKAVFNALIRANMKIDTKITRGGTFAETSLSVFGRVIQPAKTYSGTSEEEKFVSYQCNPQHNSSCFQTNKVHDEHYVYNQFIDMPIYKERGGAQVSYTLLTGTEASTLAVTKQIDLQRKPLYSNLRPYDVYMNVLMSEEDENNEYIMLYNFGWRHRSDNGAPDSYVINEVINHDESLVYYDNWEKPSANSFYWDRSRLGVTHTYYIYAIYGDKVSTPLKYEYTAPDSLFEPPYR